MIIRDKKILKELFLYLLVGGIATVAEWSFFYLADDICGWHYLPATIAAYILSTFANWIAGRLILFKETGKNILLEILSIYAASVLGLLLNLLIMWLAVDIFHVREMFAKIISTGLVFMWNFLVRKMFIYKK